MAGRMGPLAERLQGLEKSLASRVTINTDALDGLAEYDDKLAEHLKKVLPDALNVNAIDESTLRPFLEPLRNELVQAFREELVRSHFPGDRIAQIVPQVKDDNWDPQGEEQQDFVDWLQGQGYQTQEALSSFGPEYIHAMNSFIKWREGKIKEREEAAQKKTGRLAGGTQPSAQGRKPAASKDALTTEADGFLSIFKDKGS
jgi:hypothetical protein